MTYNLISMPLHITNIQNIPDSHDPSYFFLFIFRGAFIQDAALPLESAVVLFPQSRRGGGGRSSPVICYRAGNAELPPTYIPPKDRMPFSFGSICGIFSDRAQWDGIRYRIHKNYLTDSGFSSTKKAILI